MQTNLIRSIEFHSAHNDFKKIPQNSSMPQVAFCGRSNAGKSSLINAIVGRKDLVKVSATPGKTRSINLFLLNKRTFLVDLPGFGYAKASNSVRDYLIEAVNGYLNETDTLHTLFILCDGSRPLPDDEFAMIETAYKNQINPILVRTKVDKLNQKEKDQLKQENKDLLVEYSHLTIILSSIKSNLGILEIQKIITDI
ncbi:MAG: ribosome biogenesis GTP-binding protein YihA/YsxC [Leptospiraceae bacterium]|nr:ribosome biogenesis GTP-binding protein YihA/YsxC [Leptospiraceae bacterium]